MALPGFGIGGRPGLGPIPDGNGASYRPKRNFAIQRVQCTWPRGAPAADCGRCADSTNETRPLVMQLPFGADALQFRPDGEEFVVGCTHHHGETWEGVLLLCSIDSDSLTQRRRIDTYTGVSGCVCLLRIMCEL